MKRSKKSSSAVATPTIDVAVETSSKGMLARAKEAQPAQAPEPKASAPAVEKPFRFAKGTKVRYRTWDKAEGPLDREGTVTGHGPKWITISRIDGNGKVVTDWSVLGQCEEVTEQVAAAS